MFGRRRQRSVEEVVRREDAGAQRMTSLVLVVGLGGLIWGATSGPAWALYAGSAVFGLATTWCVVRSAVLSAGRTIWLETRSREREDTTS